MPFASRRTRRFSLRALPLELTLVSWLRLLWLSSVLYYEIGTFYLSLAFCKWPDEHLPPSESPTHVLLISDPQVRYVPSSRRSRISALRQLFYDLALRRNWQFASRMRPDAVFFLGDMLASGRLVRNDDEYDEYFQKFMDIFRLHASVPMYFLPGNNDVGLNVENARQARQYYTTHFGPLNQRVSVRNTTFILLDASGLVEEDYQRAAHNLEYHSWKPIEGGPVEFIKSMGEEKGVHSPIMFTHIPLHRPDTASCGLLREKGAIRRGVGPGYQNTLGKKTTNFLLQTIEPSAIFSGDDRDYCEYLHAAPPRSADDPEAGEQRADILEVTVKSFSPAADIRRPGFQLLSVVPPSSAAVRSHADALCLLPHYFGGYSAHYLPLLIATALLLLVAKLRTKRRGPSLPLTIDTPQITVSGALSSATSASKHDISPRGALPPSLRTPLNGSVGASPSSTPTLRATTRTGTPLLPSGSPRGDGVRIPAFPSPDRDAAEEGSPINYGYDDFYRAAQSEYAPAHAAYAFAAPPPTDSEDYAGGPLLLSGGLAGVMLPPPLRHLRRLLARRRQYLVARRARRGVVAAVAVDLWAVVWPALVLWCFLAWRT
ncbi:hypothetical protein B0H21DRAFT_794210 [Amylocystis lapponica]|nr:hypothetical protein B0H21DRAFT_794210 [Amylocystis lapponica]